MTRSSRSPAPGGQTMLFSATLDRNVDRLVRPFLTDPVTHSVDPAAATMEHHLLHVQAEDKNGPWPTVPDPVAERPRRGGAPGSSRDRRGRAGASGFAPHGMPCSASPR